MKVVLDIETASNITAEQIKYEFEKYRYNNPDDTKTKDERANIIIKNSSLKPQTSKVVSIAWITSRGDEYAFGIDKKNDDDKVILNEFSNFLKDDMSKIKKWVTFNGKNFDIPFIRTRCAIHGIKLPSRFCNQSMLYPFSNEYHVDLYHILKSSLQQNLLAFGLSGKIEHNWEVSKMFNNEEFERITKYCLEDTRLTAKLYTKVEGYF